MSAREKITVLLMACFLLLMGCEQPSEKLIGYVDVDYTYVASNFSGLLKKLYVKRGEPVHVNIPLFDLDPEPEISQLESAKARFLQAKETKEQREADLELQKERLRRRQALNKQGSLSDEDLQIVNAQYRQASDALAAAKANEIELVAVIKQSEWALAKKSIVSPLNGYVLETYYTVGELVPEGRPVVSLFTPQNIKVIFFIPENLHQVLKLGEKINIFCDGCKQPVAATISFISPKEEYTPPVVYSSEARSKLIYRIEARPVLTGEGYPLNPGQVVSIGLGSSNLEYGDKT